MKPSKLFFSPGLRHLGWSASNSASSNSSNMSLVISRGKPLWRNPQHAPKRAKGDPRPTCYAGLIILGAGYRKGTLATDVNFGICLLRCFKHIFFKLVSGISVVSKCCGQLISNLNRPVKDISLSRLTKTSSMLWCSTEIVLPKSFKSSHSGSDIVANEAR